MIYVLASGITPLENLTVDVHLRPLVQRVRDWASAIDLDSAGGLALAATYLMQPTTALYARMVAERPQSVRPRDVLLIEPTLPLGRIVEALGISGPSAMFGSWPVAGWHALGWALSQFKLAQAPQMLVGVEDIVLNHITWLLLGREAGHSNNHGIEYWQWLPAKPGAEGDCNLADFIGFVEGLQAPATYQAYLPEATLSISCAPGKRTCST